MTKRRVFIHVVGFLAMLWSAEIILATYADARAGGGRSGGFRGSRSFQSTPRQRPASPTQPRNDAIAQPAAAAPQSGGFMRGIGTAMLGGFLGSLLFSGLAHATGLGGFGGSGFGMIEFLLIAGVGFFLFRMLKSRAAPAAAGAGAMQYQETPYRPDPSPADTAGQDFAREPAREPLPIENIDFRSMRMMDPAFDPNRFLKSAQDMFFKIQGAWNKQDANMLRQLVGAELMQLWEQELKEQRARGRQNKMENIALRESDISEAWTENGEDYITVRWLANLLDYTVDVQTGGVVNGSDTEPIEFEEHWTFSRPVGPNIWKLSAVNQA